MRTVQLVPGAAYVMPGVCCSCGQPAGAGTLRAGGSGNAGKFTVSLEFPLCDPCAERQKKEFSSKRFGCLTLFVAIALAVSATSVLPKGAGGLATGVAWVLAIAMVAVVGRAGVAWLAEGTPTTRWGCLAGTLLSIPIAALLLLIASNLSPTGEWSASATLLAYLPAVFLGQWVAAFALGRMGRPVEPLPFYARSAPADAPVFSAVKITNVKPSGLFETGSMTVVFRNEAFGSQFSFLNGV